jgi:hypothetical protein
MEGRSDACSGEHHRVLISPHRAYRTIVVVHAFDGAHKITDVKVRNGSQTRPKRDVRARSGPPRVVHPENENLQAYAMKYIMS